ncbi:MAG: response regulator [Candidatus Lokiarchaeota archaeon]|nr:response regulator [Candidatus Lokiarchaeota archaeon]MBD3342852.1 response regulator [Candidatus Lokiarchaeota archaeon]
MSEKENELDDIQIDYDKDGHVQKTDEMRQYEKETGKYSVWRGVITEGFKKWQRGEKVYNRDKERISLYVSEDTKNEWTKFIESTKYTTISKLIRDSVKNYIKDNNSKLSPQTISNISHALKEPLTSIKGYSQLLLENYKDQLSENVISTVRNIFEQSIHLENKIINFLDNIKGQSTKYDILLIEDDIATIRLITSYFESKGYVCKGVVSGLKGIEELKNTTPNLILLDIILPDLSGYDICRTIKSNENYRDIPVYFLTAISGSEVEKQLKETGADGFILKPFNFSDFDPLFRYLKQNQ